MIPIFITLQYLKGGVKDSRRIKLSLDDRVSDVVVDLIKTLDLPASIGDDLLRYHLIRQRQVLDSEDTLLESEVQEGDILQLVILDPNATVGKAMSGAILARLGGKAGVEPLPVSAKLIANSGQEYVLSHTRALIGRADPKLGYPREALDVDLTEIDPGKTVSRPHALIVYNNGDFTIRDLYSQRGLVVNGLRMSPSKAQVLHDGDSLLLGDVIVQFRIKP